MTAHPARFWVGLLAAFVLALWLLRHILLPFVLGMAVGYLLDPLVNRLARRGIPRAAAAGVIVVAAYGTSIAAVVLLAPVLARQVIDLVAKVPAYARAAYEALSPLLHRLEAGPGSARVAELAAAAAQRATDLLGPIAASLIGRGLAVLNLVMLLAITPLVAYVGTLGGATAAVGVAVYQFWPEWGRVVVVAGIFAAGQMLNDYVLTPNLVGDKVGLHPLWILFALFAGGALLGFTGVVIAVPVAAVIGVLARFAIGRYKESPLYRRSVHVVDRDRSRAP